MLMDERCCPIQPGFERNPRLPMRFARHRKDTAMKMDGGMLMNRLLMLVLLGGTAYAQTGSSAFSTDGRVSSAPEVQPAFPAVTSAPGDGMKGLPDLLPQPKVNATLMGGALFKVDRVRDQLTLNLFGGGRTRILFDSRTHVYRDGAVASLGDLQNGARVYVD